MTDTAAHAPPIVRFAPSPTGLLHVGNARTALMNALIARRAGGTFVLRLDDTDAERSQERFARQIEADLSWLGIAPDRVVRQSDRLARYEAALEGLKSAGIVYPCYETPEELETRRRIRRARGLPPVYDRAARALSDADRARLEGQGRRPHWRFRLPVPGGPDEMPGDGDGVVAWDDLCRGRQTVNLSAVSDPVIVRADGTFLYMFPSVVDDVDLGVTHVVRGEDHVTNTGVQIAMFAALGALPPAFGHHNLIVTADGEALSKRSGALSLSALAEAGYEPAAVASLATLVGTSLPVEPVAEVAELARRLDLSAVSRSPARFEPRELDGLNAALVHAMPFEAVADRLAARGVGGGAAFWEAVRPNVARVPEAAEWWRVVEGPVDPPDPPLPEEDRAYLRAALAALPDEPFDADTFGIWTGRLKAETGRKGRTLFQPLRIALTGLSKGPELGPLLPLVGRERAARRLAAAAGADGPDGSGKAPGAGAGG